MTDDANRVFSIITSCELSLHLAMYGPEHAVVPISNILHLEPNITKYKARKALKELINEGLIYYTSQGCPAVVSRGEYDELMYEAGPPINGYALTEAGFQHDIYKSCQQSETDHMNAFWSDTDPTWIRVSDNVLKCPFCQKNVPDMTVFIEMKYCPLCGERVY